MKNFTSIKEASLTKAILLLFCLITFTVSSQASSLKIGDIAPDFTVKTLNGTIVKLSDYIDKKPVYLKFWATWCSYCKVEMPHLQAIYDESSDHVEVLTVNVGMNDSISNIERYFQKNAFNIPTIFDQKGDLTSSFGVVGTPYHVLIDKQGRINYRTFLATDLLDEKIAAWSQESIKTIVNTGLLTTKGAAR